jgi:hypothetical protein
MPTSTEDTLQAEDKPEKKVTFFQKYWAIILAGAVLALLFVVAAFFMVRSIRRSASSPVVTSPAATSVPQPIIAPTSVPTPAPTPTSTLTSIIASIIPPAPVLAAAPTPVLAAAPASTLAPVPASTTAPVPASTTAPVPAPVQEPTVATSANPKQSFWNSLFSRPASKNDIKKNELPTTTGPLPDIQIEVQKGGRKRNGKPVKAPSKPTKVSKQAKAKSVSKRIYKNNSKSKKLGGCGCAAMNMPE